MNLLPLGIAVSSAKRGGNGQEKSRDPDAEKAARVHATSLKGQNVAGNLFGEDLIGAMIEDGLIIRARPRVSRFCGLPRDLHRWITPGRIRSPPKRTAVLGAGTMGRLVQNRMSGCVKARIVGPSGLDVRFFWF
jgi:hypothetical protein